MSSIEELREVVRAQHLGDELRRAEFHAILEALAGDESVHALAAADLRGRRGYLVATSRRVFFVHAGAAGTVVAPVASPPRTPLFLESADGSASFVFRSPSGEEITLDAIPRAHAETFTRALAPRGGNGPGPASG